MSIDRFRLLNEFQRDFPLCAQPFAELALRLGSSEQEVIKALADMQRNGEVSRVGAVFAPSCIGSSTLAAVAAPAADIERIAACISAQPEVNHNYQREHTRLNLWFVATAGDTTQLAAAIARIENECGCRVLQMPLLREFHIDLGFTLAADSADAAKARRPAPALRPAPLALSLFEQRVLGALQDGLELLPRPFARLALRCGHSEEEVRQSLECWLERGFIKRFGVIVRHHELGYHANAMCVWDVPDMEVEALGLRLAGEPLVTLCYQRKRAPPEWPYNLYCMIHGNHRGAVEAELAALVARHDMDAYAGEALFSARRFKQRGARYLHRKIAGV